MINAFHCVKDSFRSLVFICFLVLNLFDPKGTASMWPKIMSQRSNIPWSGGKCFSESFEIAPNSTFGFQQVIKSLSTSLSALTKNFWSSFIPRHRRQVIRSNFYILVLSFISYLIKKHKSKQLLYIMVKYIFQRACLNYLTAVNI